MLVMADVPALVFESISKVQSLGNNWYQATESWNDLPRKVERLQREYDRWRAKISEFGLSSNPPEGLAASFNELKRLFDDEHAELERRQAQEESCCGWGAVLGICTTAMFPASLGASVDQVTATIERVLPSLQMDMQIDEVFKKRIAQTISSLPFRMDQRYVHLIDLESEICALVDDPHGPGLVLLHGGPGKGKSTLARYIALRYREGMGYPVMYLECGSRAEMLGKQLELLEKLGSDMATIPRMNGEPVRKQLIFRLREQKMIMVLDDVDNRDFLQRMVGLCGTNVTCLVTSQRGDLCTGVNESRYKTIDMDDTAKDNAKKMLAAHSGFLNQEIPSHLEAIVEEILGNVGENPLAITTIATAIDQARNEEIEEWEAVSSEVLTLLHSEENLPYTFDNKYPRSFWASMQLLFNSLTGEMRILLLLVHMCQTPSVPEEIVIFLHTRIRRCQDSTVPFIILRRELESRHLVQIREALEGTRKQRSWSVHSLQRKFMTVMSVNKEEKDAREQVFASLRGQRLSGSIHTESDAESNTQEEVGVGNTLDSKFSDLVTALYLDEHFARRIASDLKVDFSRFSDYRLRPFIEPIIRLIVRDSGRLRKANIWDRAREVSIGYICGGQVDGIMNGVFIDDDFIRTLYGSSDISNRMLTYVKHRLYDNNRVSAGPNVASQLQQSQPVAALMDSVTLGFPPDARPELRIASLAADEDDGEFDGDFSTFAFGEVPISLGEATLTSNGEAQHPVRWSTYLDYEVDSLFEFF